VASVKFHPSESFTSTPSVSASMNDYQRLQGVDVGDGGARQHMGSRDHVVEIRWSPPASQLMSSKPMIRRW
jgi:hypothetical protein